MAEHLVTFRCADCDTKQKHLVPKFGKIYCEACGRAHRVTGTPRTGYWAHPASSRNVPVVQIAIGAVAVGALLYFVWDTLVPKSRRSQVQFDRAMKSRLMGRAASFARILQNVGRKQPPEGLVLRGQGAKQRWPKWYAASPVAKGGNWSVRSGRMVQHETKQEAAWVEMIFMKDGESHHRKVLWFRYGNKWYLDVRHPPSEPWTATAK